MFYLREPFRPYCLSAAKDARTDVIQVIFVA